MSIATLPPAGSVPAEAEQHYRFYGSLGYQPFAN